jgi:hypothetical protein
MLGKHSTPWFDSSGNPWWLTFHWGEVDGRPECVGLDVRGFMERGGKTTGLAPGGALGVVSGPDLRAVTASLLRDMPLASLVRENKQAASDLRRWYSTQKKATRRGRQLAFKQAEAFEAPRQRKYGREHYAKVAEIYATAYGKHQPPTKAVAESPELGGPVSRSTAAKWVARAREMHLLGTTSMRKAGGVDSIESES